MSLAAAPGLHDAHLPGAASPPSGNLRFMLRASVLALLYLAVVVAWGQRNAWPDELLACIVALPVTALTCWRIAQAERFGFSVDTRSGQQEQLIAALVLAVGLASGQLVLMSGGLSCLFVGWLRPDREDIDLAEWLKMPLLWFGALPFWLDFEGGRSSFAAVLEDPLTNPVYRLPLSIAVTQAHVLSYCAVTALALTVRGRLFWLTLPLVPPAIAGLCFFPRAIPGWASVPPVLRLWTPWVAGALLFHFVGKVLRTITASPLPIAPGQRLRRWLTQRRHPPWIAVVVVALVQTVPLRQSSLESLDAVALAGMAVLVGLLCFLRTRTPRGPIHSRSTALVAGALALALVGEFTSIALARRASLGLVVVGLVSWHCLWSLRILGTAIFTTGVLLGVPTESPLPGLASSTLGTIRIVAATLGLLLLAWLTFRPLPPAGASGYDETGWVPSKRFALILLGLMLLFQLASAFWPEHEMPVPHPNDATQPALPSHALSGADSATAQDPPFASDDPEGVLVRIQHPRGIPYLLESPQRTLERRGWRTVSSRTIPRPGGNAAAVVASRDGQSLGFLWWFEQGDTAFASHRFARRVLWSSWFLANRDLRLVTLQSSSLTQPDALIEHARRHQWFARDAAATTP